MTRRHFSPSISSRKADAKNLAGFTIACEPKGQPAYYIHNELRFEKPGDHAQVANESASSSINAPIHKFRWVHVPGQVHQGLKPFFGNYTYTVTPRFFDENHSLTPVYTENLIRVDDVMESPNLTE